MKTRDQLLIERLLEARIPDMRKASMLGVPVLLELGSRRVGVNARDAWTFSEIKTKLDQII